MQKLPSCCFPRANAFGVAFRWWTVTSRFQSEPKNLEKMDALHPQADGGCVRGQSIDKSNALAENSFKTVKSLQNWMEHPPPTNIYPKLHAAGNCLDMGIHSLKRAEVIMLITLIFILANSGLVTDSLHILWFTRICFSLRDLILPLHISPIFLAA